MKIPVGMTYVAHTVLALVALGAGAVFVSMKLGWTDFGSAQAIGTLLGMFAAIPAFISVLVTAYSAIAAVVALVRRRPVPRAMLLLPAALVVSFVVGSVCDDLETPLWTVVAYLPLAGYVIMTFVLAARYRSSRRAEALRAA